MIDVGEIERGIVAHHSDVGQLFGDARVVFDAAKRRKAVIAHWHDAEQRPVRTRRALNDAEQTQRHGNGEADLNAQQQCQHHGDNHYEKIALVCVPQMHHLFELHK